MLTPNLRHLTMQAPYIFQKTSSSQSNLAATTVPIGNYDGDMDALVENGIYCVGENENLPTQVYYSQAIVCRGKNSDTVVQIVIDYDSATMMFRGASNTSGQWDWVDWQQVAIAAPPQEFDLPLLDGWYTNDRVQYRKTQEGLVVVNAILELSEGYDASDNTQIAVLPEGFRPATSFMYPVSVQDGSTRASAIVRIGTNGTIIYYGASNTTAVFRIYLNAAFFAAS